MLAGQSVACPECQQALRAPSLQRPVVYTSGFALASFLLAVAGAFTVVGTIAAVVLGLIAVVRILRDREHVAGLGFAGFGIGLGLAFTAATVWAISTGELFGLAGAARRTQMAGQLEPADEKASLDIHESGFSLTRPTAKWLRAKKDFRYPLVQPLLRDDALLLLVQPELYAFLDVQAEANHQIGPAVEGFILDRLKQGEDEDASELSRITKATAVGTPKALPKEEGVRQANEMTAEVTLDGKRWTLLVRTFQMTSGRLFIVRAFTETMRFGGIKDELARALDSFKVTAGF